MDLCTTQRNLEVNMHGPSMMFGDNSSFFQSSSLLKSRLHKPHVMLSFHCVCEAITAGVLCFKFIAGSLNLADVMSKHWGYQIARVFL